jgi:RNA-directed DNA polymerase
VTDDPIKKLKAQLAGLPDATVRERMMALGFWPPGEPLPSDPIEEAKARAALESDRARLLSQAGTAENPEKALRKERIRRLRESQKRRSLRKLEREIAQKKRREAWSTEKAGLLVHAGEGVSAGLEKNGSDAAKLEAAKLPVIHDAVALAAALGISIAQLRFLTYHRRGATLVHYHRFGIPKKTGGIRAISAPKPRSRPRSAGCWRPSSTSASRRARRRTASSSPLHRHQRHAPRRQGVVNLDLKDFFPSVTFRRVKGCSRSSATTSTSRRCSRCSHRAAAPRGAPRRQAPLDRARRSRAAAGRVHLPAITNLVCRTLDARLAGLARHFGFTYTRYADDLTFSGDDREKVGRLLGCVRKVLKDEGFREHGDKTHVMGRGRRQEVTGVVVNEKLSLAKDEKRALRAILHNVAKNGLAAENREKHDDFAGYLRGRVAFACMVDPSLRRTLEPALAKALARG